MKLTKQALSLLKVVLTTTGEKELNLEGQEVTSSRRLNGEESAQRRHFLKVADPILEELGKSQTDFLESAKEAYKKENPQKKGVENPAYEQGMFFALNKDKKMLEDMSKLSKEEVEISPNDKVTAVVKKYFEEYGEKNGWTSGDDDLVEEVSGILK